MPPTIFGTVFVVWSTRPGSTRSGENASLKSAPARRPLPASRSGSTSSRVVPGYELEQLFGGHVLDRALTTVELLDALPVDVDQHDRLPGIGEHLGERNADVARTDDRDVVRRLLGVGCGRGCLRARHGAESYPRPRLVTVCYLADASTAAIRCDAYPSP